MGAVQFRRNVVRADELDRFGNHRTAEAGLQAALVAGVVDARLRAARHGGAALLDGRHRAFGIAREFFRRLGAADELAQRAVGRHDLLEAAVEQRVGNAGLLLRGFGKRLEACVHRAGVDDEIGLERIDRLEVDSAAAAGEPRHLRPGRDFREQELAFRGAERLEPTDQEIGRERIEQHRRRRTGRIDTRHAVGRGDGPAGRVGGRRRKAMPRRDERGGKAAEKRSAVDGKGPGLVGHCLTGRFFVISSVRWRN